MIYMGMLAMMLGGQAAVPAAPLPPASRWHLEYAPDLCVLSRRFGDPVHPITIGFRPTPFGDAVQTVVLGPRAAIGFAERVSVQVGQPDGTLTTEVDGVRNRLANGKEMGVTVDLPRDVVNALAGRKQVAFKLSGARPITVALSLSQTALDGLKRCETDLMASWGFDPVKIAAAAVPATIPAEGNPAHWFTSNDYPISKMDTGALVVIAWAITVDGRVANCRAVRSSGTAEFDQAACHAITKRGRYTPARDASGKAVESYASRRVRFQP